LSNNIMSNFKIFLILFALLLFASPGFAGDEIYKYVDEQGNMHFVDSAEKIPPKYRAHTSEHTPSGNLSIVETPQRKKKTANPSARKANSNRNSSGQKARRTYRTNAHIELYVTSWCGYCKKARQYFQQHDLRFTEYDIERDDAAASRMRYISNQSGVPVIKVDDRVLTGFSARALDELLLQ
jgi:glutaredoxin-like YruB-family protein